MTDHLDLQVRFDVEEAGTFTGHAVIFGEANRHREIYQRGSFARTLAEHRSAKTTPPMFWAHNPSEVIGVWTDLREDDRGLAVSGQLLMDTVRGREVASMLKARAVTGLSIGFRPRQSSRGAGGTRTVTDVDLVEISLVALPSANSARIAAYREAPDTRTLSAFVEACRSATETYRSNHK